VQQVTASGEVQVFARLPGARVVPFNASIRLRTDGPRALPATGPVLVGYEVGIARETLHLRPEGDGEVVRLPKEVIRIAAQADVVEGASVAAGTDANRT